MAHSYSTIYCSGSILGVAEIREQILSYTSVLNVIDWCGLGRNIQALTLNHSEDPEYYLNKLFLSLTYIMEVLSCGTVSLRGPSLDIFARTRYVHASNTDLYMFIPVQATFIPRFIRVFTLLLQSEGHICLLRDWSLDTRKLFHTVPGSTGSSSFDVPYFSTKSGSRVSILIYDDSKNIAAWNNIPGISIYSPGFTIISATDLITTSEVEKIRLYRFFAFPSRDLTVETPLEYIEVCGYHLCLAMGCDPWLSSTSFTMLTRSYLSMAIEYKALGQNSQAS